MNELKDRWFWAYPTESVDCDGITGSAHEVYSKSEVDEVLAEKDTKIIQLEALIENYNRISREIIDNANHQKYKRCLGNAAWCKDKMQHYMYDDKVILYGFIFYERWYKCWLEIAKKFKEAK